MLYESPSLIAVLGLLLSPYVLSTHYNPFLSRDVWYECIVCFNARVLPLLASGLACIRSLICTLDDFPRFISLFTVDVFTQMHQASFSLRI